MSVNSTRRHWMSVWTLALVCLSVARAEDEVVPNYGDADPSGRIFLSNYNNTLIPLGAGGAFLASTIGVIAIVIGAVFLFSLIFNPNTLKNGGLFSPWLSGYPGSYGGYQQGGYYGQQQAQPYLYEPYSKLGGYQTQQTAR